MLSDFITNAKIYDNEIRDCGIHDFVFDDGGKTGEGICKSREKYSLLVQIPSFDSSPISPHALRSPMVRDTRYSYR